MPFFCACSRAFILDSIIIQLAFSGLGGKGTPTFKNLGIREDSSDKCMNKKRMVKFAPKTSNNICSNVLLQYLQQHIFWYWISSNAWTLSFQIIILILVVAKQLKIGPLGTTPPIRDGTMRNTSLQVAPAPGMFHSVSITCSKTKTLENQLVDNWTVKRNR